MLPYFSELDGDVSHHEVAHGNFRQGRIALVEDISPFGEPLRMPFTVRKVLLRLSL